MNQPTIPGSPTVKVRLMGILEGRNVPYRDIDYRWNCFIFT